MSHRRRQSPHCIRCGKKFAREEDVLNHMNQPWSKCASLMHDLIKISDTINIPHENQNGSPELQHVSPSGTPADDNFNMDIVDTSDKRHRSTSSNLTDITTQMHTETFPGAGHTYEIGQTFMNNFDADQYAHQRTSNLYYPFASKAEWQLLLQSNLSMQAIDEFLHLNLVSVNLLIY